jgi:EAL domain-containing protein (putative c-di-GMP-specific phosphodiesterase class I)
LDRGRAFRLPSDASSCFLLAQAMTAEQKARILAVDDEEALLRYYQRAIGAGGYEVVTCERPADALHELDTSRFDVIITDLAMPGMSGIELLRAVRTRDMDVPVIIITASPALETALQAIDEGALKYLVKPVRAEELLGTIERAVALGRMSRLKRQALALLQQRGDEPGDRATAAAAFDRALSGLTMAYQPVVDVAQGTVFGYEALMRTTEKAYPSPLAVLEAAERLDRLQDLGRRIRELVAVQAAQAPDGAAILVNLHPRDLLDEQLFDRRAPLSLVAKRVILEITERSLLEDVANPHARIARLRSLGFRVAVDDLGAGYAGLNSFAQLEPDVVKLDLSLVRDIHLSAMKRSLVQAMIEVCRTLNVLLIAEGVETAAERDVLTELRCPLMQGYLFAKPAPGFNAPTLA